MKASPSRIAWQIKGSPASPLCSDVTETRCWICGTLTTRAVLRHKWSGSAFAGQNKVRYPEGDYVCEPCIVVMSGRGHDTERLWTHLIEGGAHARVNKAHKPAIRDFLRKVHAEPWLAAISDTGQKHILPWAPVNRPGIGGRVLFEESVVVLPSTEDGWGTLDRMMDALTAGLTKEEILSGEYGSRAWTLLGEERLRALEAEFGPLRGGHWFSLLVWLAQRDEAVVQARLEAEKVARVEAKKAERAAAKAPKKAKEKTSERRTRNASKSDRGAVALHPVDVPAHDGRQRAEALGSDLGSASVGGAANDQPGGVVHGNEPKPEPLKPDARQLGLFG